MIVCWSHGDADDNMDEGILVELASIIERHPWWQARGELLVALLKQFDIDSSAEMLEAGCGWGTNLTQLEKSGFAVTGLDISRQALERLDRHNRTLIEADLSKPLPEDVRQYDVVLALDVIEHIDDDRGVVQRLAQLVRPGGIVVLSVPALPELYSEFDRIQGHRRRYTPATLQQAIDSSGLTVERILWWGQWMTRILGHRKSATRGNPGDTNAEIYKKYLKLPPWPVSYLMKLMFALDRKRTLEGRNAIGTSLFAVMRRTSQGV